MTANLVGDLNSQAFTPEEVEAGMLDDLLKYLLDYSKKSDRHYNEIHITSDGYCQIVEWTSVPYDGEWGGSFQYIDEEHYVLKEVRFPDGHYEYLHDSEEEEALKEWEEEHKTKGDDETTEEEF